MSRARVVSQSDYMRCQEIFYIIFTIVWPAGTAFEIIFVDTNKYNENVEVTATEWRALICRE